MARVFIDSSVVGDSWFKEALVELEGCANVIFVCCFVGKALEEMERTRKLLEFLQRMGQMSRTKQVADPEYSQRTKDVVGSKSWETSDECDDEHIFAITYVAGKLFVFSKDSRLADCRKLMNAELDKRFCAFRIISSDPTYKKHRDKILS